MSDDRPSSTTLQREPAGACPFFWLTSGDHRNFYATTGLRMSASGRSAMLLHGHRAGITIMPAEPARRCDTSESPDRPERRRLGRVRVVDDADSV